MPKNKTLAAAWIILACFLSVLAGRAYWGPSGHLPLERRITARSKGDPKAAVWIVEYFDFQCGACRSATKFLDEYIEKYPHRVYLQARFHPLQHHPFGLRTAVYGECAARQGKYWPLHDKFFAEQETWAAATDPESLFKEYAAESGIDMRKLDACLEDPRAEESVLKEREEGLSLGITSTPTSFVNGKMLVGIQRLKDEIEERFPSEKDKP